MKYNIYSIIGADYSGINYYYKLDKLVTNKRGPILTNNDKRFKFYLEIKRSINNAYFGMKINQIFKNNKGIK